MLNKKFYVSHFSSSHRQIINEFHFKIIQRGSLMQVTMEPKRTKHIEPSPFLQQTAFWGRLKKKHGFDAKAFDIIMDALEEPAVNDELYSPERNNSQLACISHDILVVIRSLAPNVYMAYVPFGPELLPDKERRGRWLEQLSERLRPYLPDTCIFIRYDLPWESPWVDDKSCYSDDNIWLGEPKTRVREMRMNFDTKHWNLRKAPTDLLPIDTVILDLNSENDQILKHMKPKTRYNIRLSARKGVRVREASIDELPAWYDIYYETAQRHCMLLNDMDYFKSVLQVRAKDSNSPARIHMLLAEVKKKVVAGMMMAVTGPRATYLYGASSSNFRDYMAPYALQWTAIRKAKEAGCSEYDLFGISPNPDPNHPMYGLYRFKTGFGGSIIHRQGCWDYPFDEVQYEIYRTYEMKGPAFVI